MKRIVPWNLATAVRWEAQVEKALRLPSAEQILSTAMMMIIIHKAPEVGPSDQHQADLLGHADHVEQWVSDDHITIVRHGSYEEDLSGGNYSKEAILRNEPALRNGFALHYEIDQDIGSNGGEIAGV
ncbi:unnamed protein product [Caretta caretta]